MNNILQAFGDIAEVLPRMDKLKAVFGDVDFQRVVGLIYSDIVEFLQRVYKFFCRRSWHLWFTFEWGMFERRFKSILEKLANHSELLDKEAAANHYLKMKNMADEREEKDKEFEQRERNKRALEVFTSLSAAATTQENHLHQIAEFRQLGTCDWLLENSRIDSWIKDESGDACVWMTGIPGAGKSFLCSLIVEHLETKCDRTTAYYFCDHRSSDRNDCGLVLRTLAVQILRQNLDLVPLIHEKYPHTGSGHSDRDVKKMLNDLVSSAKPTRIVLDGVDECDFSVQTSILKSLLELQRVEENCKILVSSRLGPQIDKAMPNKFHITLDGKTVGALKLYIRNSVEDLKGHFTEFEPDLFDRVQHRLEEKAKGMFLWVRLVTSMLKQYSSEVEFENAINQLPDGLDQAYGLVLRRIYQLDTVLKKRVLRILFWVCLTYRPITIDEVADGIALIPGQTILDKKHRSQNTKRDILDICAPIIERSRNGVLSLVHFTAEEYLLDHRSGPFIDIAKAHFSVAFSCIVNLSTTSIFLPRVSHGMSESEVESLVVRGSFGLHSYGNQYWAQHVIAYLENTSIPTNDRKDLDEANDRKDLDEALQKLSQLQKRPDSKNSVGRLPHQILKELQKLDQSSSSYSFVIDWLLFKSRRDEMGTDFASPDDQEEWQLQNDETYLSLVESNLRKVVEKLLKLDQFNLPTHIEKDDFAAFVSRHGFVCKSYKCGRYFGRSQDRDVHELSHVSTYSCLKCDFFNGGFNSRKGLENHTRRYHMSPEDFEIPSSLSIINSYAPGSSVGPIAGSRLWNEQGRKAIRSSFLKALTRVKTHFDTNNQRNNQLSFSSAGRHDGTNKDQEQNTDLTLARDLHQLQERIEEDHYQRSADFIDDVSEIFKSQSSAIDLISICHQEIEKTTKGLPDFYPSKTALLNHDNRQSLFTNHETFSEEDISLNGSKGKIDAFRDLSLQQRMPYWSSIEKKEFPELLGRYGRDYMKISEFLKSKSADDVEKYLRDPLNSGRSDLSKIADDADARLRLLPPSPPVRPIPGIDISSHIKPSAQQLIIEDMQKKPGVNLDLTHNSVPVLINLNPPIESRKRRSNEIQDSENTTSGPEKTNRPKKYTRRQPPRARCPHCDAQPDGFWNENSLKKHITRFHIPTRKVWICQEFSNDGSVLAGFSSCKSCSNHKRYSSKTYAARHLRLDHSRSEEPADVLKRWTTESEERNPKFFSSNR